MLVGLPTLQFHFAQHGLGIFHSMFFNVIDFVFAVLLTAPVVTVIFMEVYIKGIQLFISRRVRKFVGIRDTVQHASKTMVCVIWPIISVLLCWRIVRTIGQRISLAPHSD